MKNAHAAEMIKKCKRIKAEVSQLHPMERLVKENRYMRQGLSGTHLCFWPANFRKNI